MTDLSQSVTLSIRNIEPQGQTGTYLVSGDATGLNGATVAVTAMRQLSNRQAPNYSLLDRQYAEIEDGRWTTELQIWQSDRALSSLESWQIERAAFNLSFNPDPKVTFMVSLEPTEALKWPDATLETREGSSDSAAVIQYTPDSEKYLVAESIMTIPVPANSGGITDSVTRRSLDRTATAINPRAQSGAAVSAATSRSTAPLTPTQYMQ
ncbi:MAG: hypothetical protein AAF289_01275 [Cyanobacteria bacterium P01_A01_bin.135]